jgi:hypothetical protein
LGKKNPRQILDITKNDFFFFSQKSQAVKKGEKVNDSEHFVTVAEIPLLNLLV